jgi:hypothetical protein
MTTTIEMASARRCAILRTTLPVVEFVPAVIATSISFDKPFLNVTSEIP